MGHSTQTHVGESTFESRRLADSDISRTARYSQSTFGTVAILVTNLRSETVFDVSENFDMVFSLRCIASLSATVSDADWPI